MNATLWAIDKFDELPLEQQVVLMQAGLFVYRAGRLYFALAGAGIPCSMVTVVSMLGVEQAILPALVALVRNGGPKASSAADIAHALHDSRPTDNPHDA
jgi:hypothetical protein